MTSPIRVLLVDDHVLFRSALRALLDREAGFRVVGTAAEGEEAVELSESLRPDVVIMDLLITGMDGIEATRRIVERCPETRVLVVTVRRPEETLAAAIDAGARGYLTKDRADHELLDAIRTVARDEAYLQGRATGLLLRRYRDDSEIASGSPLEDLSDREREVLTFTALGYSGREIGERLDISAKTVDTYRARVRRKLGVESVPELVRVALQEGLLDEPLDAEDAGGAL